MRRAAGARQQAAGARPRAAGRRPGLLARAGLAVGAALLTLLVLELALRWLDPYPYIPPWERNVRPHGNLTQHDELLGWKGIPSQRALFATANARVWITHNREGFRDVEPEARRPGLPAIAFLGDSFTWGYEVGDDEVFVERLRAALDDYELYNLAHAGYGTDQQLLLFRQWTTVRRLALVVLVFCANDVADARHAERYEKPKPRFVLDGGELVLTNVPVRRVRRWDKVIYGRPEPAGWRDRVGAVLLGSHLLHHLHARWTRPPPRFVDPGAVPRAPATGGTPDRLALTERLLAELADEVAARGSRLLVVAVPSKAELFATDREPYQRDLEALCRRLGIAYRDLAGPLRDAPLRTYFRDGWHWTPYGHRIVARELAGYVRALGL